MVSFYGHTEPAAIARCAARPIPFGIARNDNRSLILGDDHLAVGSLSRGLLAA